MSQLSEFQNKLIKDLTAEFERLNPKVTESTKPNRFSIEMIENCLSEKQRFIDSVNRYNVSIAKVLKKTFDSEVKKVAKELDKYFTIQNGSYYGKLLHDSDTYLFGGANKVSQGTQSQLYIVSRTKKDEYYRATHNFVSLQIYCRFKLITDSVTLKSGEVVNMHKIIGLKFSDKDYLNDKSSYIADSLDSFIQNNQMIQRRLIDMCK